MGGDFDSRAVDHATANHVRPNLTYHAIDAAAWRELDREKPVRKVDYVVCFDTLEHLLHREIMLINVAESLPPSGMLLLSTPCGRRYNVLNPGWEHHKVEYSYEYLYNLMRRFFDTVLVPDDGTLPELEFWNERVNTGVGGVRYFLRANPMVCLKPRALGLRWSGAHHESPQPPRTPG